MTITRKATLLALALAVACAIALTGCGNSGASSNAGTSSSANSNAAANSSAASAQQADEQAQQYVGTWKAYKVTLQVKTNASDNTTDVDVPIVIELYDDMTGKVTFGESTQDVEWEVRYWDALKVERAVIWLHETFPLGKIECDAEDLMLELQDSGNRAHYFANWNSAAQPGAKISVDTMVERVS